MKNVFDVIQQQIRGIFRPKLLPAGLGSDVDIPAGAVYWSDNTALQWSDTTYVEWS